MSTKDTAAPTAVAHELVTSREGARLKGLNEARKPEGRKRKGITQREERDIIAMLKDGKSWRDVEKRYGREVEAEVLDGWRANLEKRSQVEPGPRLPRTGEPE
jgi:hypothetical protein